MTLKLLIAEDNKFTAQQYNKILQKHGHEVTITQDGEECIKKYEEESKKGGFDKLDKNPFDVVVLDQSMPKKMGAQVAETILGLNPTQRIIFASAYALDDQKTSDDLKLSIEFLPKPFSLTKFVNRILRK